MNTIYDSRQLLKYIFIAAAVLIAVVSVFVSDKMIQQLAQEERQRIEIWADAIRMLTSNEERVYEQNLNLALKIGESNTTIPVVLCDAEDNIITYKNLNEPEENREQFLQKKVEELKHKKESIVIDLQDGVYQYLYYDDSIILKRLLIYPYVQLSVMFIFIALAFLALASTKKAEQNKVWVGLSKETAHQLGTPISSLVAWVEYLRTKDLEPALLVEIEKDVKRLETIAERFSKIGSKPDPEPIDLVTAVQSSLAYMERRISSKVKIYTHLPEDPVKVCMNGALFEWVLENLIKNAVDAMEGQGEISLRLENNGRTVKLDISDTGKGIPKSRHQTVFNPGYTTKARGWGLGLSLVKRIIESYHGGKIYVKSSEPGKGTTFRIELRKYAD